MSDDAEETFLQQENFDQLGDVLPAILFISVLMILGFFGNILVVYVYMFRFKPSTLRCFIIALAAIDIAICGFDIPIRILVLRYKYTFGRYRDLCKVFYTCHDSLFLASMYMLISVAVERFRKVCQPLRTQMTIFSAKVIILVCCCVAFLFGLPAAFKYGTKTIPTSDANITGKQCYRDDNHNLTLVEANYIFWIITNIGVLTTLVVLYSLIWRRVAKQLKFRNNNRSVKKKPIGDKSTEDLSASVDPSDHSSDNESTLPRGSSSKDGNENSEKSSHHKNPVSNLARKASAWIAEEKRQQGIRRMTTVMSVVTLMSIIAYLPVVTKMIVQLINSGAFSNFKYSARWAYNVYVHTYYLQCAANPLIYSFWNPKFRYELKHLRVKMGTPMSSSSHS